MVWATGLSALGGIGSSALSAASSKKIAAMQINWERERAKNAHQWQVKDLQNAGINPVYTATGGAGATTGSINPPTPDYSGINTGMANAAQMIAVKAQTALSAAQTKKTIEETKNVTPLAKSQANKNLEEALTEKEKRRNLSASTKYNNERARGKSESYSGQIGNKWIGTSGSHSKTW